MGADEDGDPEWGGLACPPGILAQVHKMKTYPTNGLTDPEYGMRLYNLGVHLFLFNLLNWKQGIHFAEIFRGKAVLSDEVENAGMLAHSVDKKRHKHHDMSTLEGFVLIGLLMGSIVPGGVAWFAPQCSTWLSFMCA
eukprot:9477667-Pyramimonas_sp.AAC.1